MEAKSGDTAGNHYLKGKVPSGPGRTWPPRLQSNGQSAPPWVHLDGPRGNLSPVPALQHLLVKGLCHQNTGRWTRGSAPPAMASAQAAAAARSCCWRGVPRSALGHQVPQTGPRPSSPKCYSTPHHQKQPRPGSQPALGLYQGPQAHTRPASSRVGLDWSRSPCPSDPTLNPVLEAEAPGQLGQGLGSCPPECPMSPAATVWSVEPSPRMRPQGEADCRPDGTPSLLLPAASTALS